jgi:hypothetical protein
MKRTNPALEMAALATSARACAPGMRGRTTTIAGFPASDLKRNGHMGTENGVQARRQQRLTT